MKEIAEKIKMFRTAKRLSLRQLAKKAGCTDAYLSKVERGLANPSVMILKKIATALEVNIADFFVDPELEKNDDIVMKEQDRINMSFRRGGAKIQMLVRNIRTKRMQPFYTIIEPGGGSDGEYTHIGEEWGMVLQGVLDLNLNGKIYKIKKNESFYFSSNEPHSWGNSSKKKTIVFWVVSPPTF